MTVLTNSGLPVVLSLALLFAVPVVLDTIRRRRQREAFAAHLASVRKVAR